MLAKIKSCCLSAFLLLGLIVAPGCTSGRTGILDKLPGPVVHVASIRTSRPHFTLPKIGLPHWTPPKDAGPQHSAGVPRSWRPRVHERAWTAIVIHHSATQNGGAKAFNEYHVKNRGWDELGYHFVIGNGTDTSNGLVEVGPRWRKQKHGAHCKTPDNYYNEHGIGICLVGDFNQQYPSRKQMRSLEKLVSFLMQRYNIPVERVHGHGELGHTRCPGRHMSISSFRARMDRKVRLASSR